MKTVTIIGAGLVGSLLSLYLVKRGYKVTVYESRADPRRGWHDNGLSINLALSCRGQTGLAGVNLLTDVKALMAPMRARAIHELDRAVKYQPFGRHSDEFINAVQRNELNNLLLEKAQEHSDIELHFGVKLQDINLYQKSLHGRFENGNELNQPYERLIGADGASSFVRETLVREKHAIATRTWLPHGYKEISISARAPQHLAHEHLHLWPGDTFLLLGNPNPDHSVTGSLFLAHEGKNSFAELNSELKINSFFSHYFPDIYEKIPDLSGDFMNHPVGGMSTVDCSPWYFEDHCLLAGDAAHGIVPFFGQGMNSGFEDCRILNSLLDQYQDDWQKVLPAFYKERKINTDAVSAMSMDNYREIQSDIRDPQFNLKKQLEQELMHRYPQLYQSKHVLVMFSNIPYAKAQSLGEIQLDLLNTIVSGTSSIKTIDWSEVDRLMKLYDKKLTNLLN